MSALMNMWESHQDLFLVGLGVFNLLLFIYIASKIPALMKKRPGAKLVRDLGKQGDAHLFEIKAFMDGTDDRLALYAFREIVKKNSNAVNESMVMKVIFRATKFKTLFISCLYRIAKGGNPRLVAELLAQEIPDWVYVVCLRILCKDKSTDIVAVLVRAKDHSSPEIQNAAAQLLEKIDLSKVG
jgi:hypothetical protein